MRTYPDLFWLLARLSPLPAMATRAHIARLTHPPMMIATTACFLAFMLLVSIGVRSAAADQCVKDGIAVTDGACWNSLAPMQKGAIIRGIWVGLETRSNSDDLIDQDAFYFVDRDWAGTPSSTTVGDIIGYFDKLYETPANRSIGWSWAYLLAAMYARDDDSNDRLALLKFIREHGMLPVYGEIADVIDEDHLLIRSGEKNFKVKIAGVSGDNLTDGQKDRAASFLRGIINATYFHQTCVEQTRRSVTLVYRHDIFGEENELSANIKLFPISAICAGGRRVELSEIVGAEVDYVDLSKFLVATGLLKPDSYREDKWSEDTVVSRNYEGAAKKAEEKQLYLYGDSRIETVDAIIEYGSTLSAINSSPASIERDNPLGANASPKAGSGFFVTPTIAVTNAHVVSECRVVSASGADRVVHDGRVLASDATNDLALIQFADPFADASVVHFGAGRPPRVGDAIFIGGYPLSGLLASGLSVADGVVSNSAGIGDDIRMMQVTAPVQPGNSGGPVLNGDGILVGVVTSKLDAIAVAQTTGDIPQNVNFAIKASVVRAMLDAYEIEYATEPQALGGDGTVYDRLKRVSIYIQCG